MAIPLNRAQTKYLEELLQTSSIETLSSGLASVLLHLSELEIEEVLTLSLICCATCVESEDDLSELLLQKKLDLRATGGICMRFANILIGAVSTLPTDGNGEEVEDSPLLANISLPVEPMHT